VRERAAPLSTLVLAAEDIRRIALQVGLDALMDEAIARLTAAFQSFDPSATTIPSRQGFVYTRPEIGLLEWMPCMSDGTHATIKLVGYHPHNPRTYNLPTIVSTVSAYDIRTGHLTCLMDGTFLTALRTGAASAIATRLMASPKADVVGLIGGGAQAVTQLHALSRVLPLRRALVHDRDPRVAGSFAARAAAVAGSIRIERAPLDEVVQQADVICTATSVGVGEGPLFDGIEPRPWAHFNAVGSDFQGKFELPASLLRRSFVCPDFRQQALLEGECQQLTPAEVGPNLFEVVQRREQFGSLTERLTVFDSTGWALEDHVTMELLMAHASALGVGRRIAIETASADALNPYDFLAAPASAPATREGSPGRAGS
jgi:ornithine cyclodeaminase/alanine dehydrogenase-like protein (mu-crystallin family)